LISVVQLGRIDYATGLRLQQTLVDLRKAGQIGDVLLLLEHTPVITLGRNARRQNVLASDQELASRGVELFECDRGGDVTFHGPGQLVGYPIFDLHGFLTTPEGARKTLGAVEFVRRLEEVLIRACADFGVAATRVPGLTGVWTDPQAGGARPPSAAEEQAKIAAIGIHISRGVTSHGFALNVTADLDYFKLIIPCGIVSRPVTSLAKETGNPIEWTALTESVTRNFGRVFSRQILWLETLDALLGHKVGVPLKVPEEIRRARGDEDTFLA